MNAEIMQYKGQLADLKYKLQEQEIEAKGLIAHIRMNLNPFQEDVTAIETAQISQSAARLDNIVKEMRKMKMQIKDIEDALNV